jgi:hypothetical protein
MASQKHNYKTFNSAADGAMASIIHEATTTLSDRNRFDPIETYISRWVTSLQRGEYDESDLELTTSVLKRAGVEALNWLVENQGPNIPDIVQIVCDKQHDYGHKNITNFGTIGVAIRVCDKIARIKNLEASETPKNESLVDSYVDIVGYAIIAIMLDNESFHLNLEKRK